ncbi:MAG TPA: peptide-N4-asparagine amidase [Rhodanobacteraceae bacterium]
MKHVPVILAGLIAIAGCGGTAHAHDAPAIGSRNVATVTPDVPRPGTKPCVVPLFTRHLFGKTGDSANMGSTPYVVSYRPPAGCQGPWAKVVLEMHFAVAAGHQYDRTASLWMNGVNLYFGSTEEPSPGVARDWNIQRDLTDYTSLLRHPGSVDVRINNWLGKVFSSPIHASAKLLFYPADKAYPAPAVPDKVIALNGKDNTPAKLDRDHNLLARNVTFPRNTTRVYLDLFAEPQAHDEFYYVCLPDQTIARVGDPGSNGSLDRAQTCDGGAFREAEVLIDGQPAGLAPVTPWIFTGGLDPFLWQPTPGPEALNFVPYRVNLSPFAGLLSDGKPHTVAVRMLGQPNFFSVAGTLLVYQDNTTQHTGGALTRNTLKTANLRPTIDDELTGHDGHVDGGIFTRASTHYVIEGYVDTPKGRQYSSVDTTIGFDNTQHFATADKHRCHLSWQHARVDSTSRTSGAQTRSLRKIIDYALDVRTVSRRGQGKNLHRGVQLSLRLARHIEQRQAGLPPYIADMSNIHVGSANLAFQRGQRLTYTDRDQTSTQTFRFTNSLGDCRDAQVQARDRAVTAYTQGQGCLAPKPMHWFAHPDGSPDSFGWRGVVHD